MACCYQTPINVALILEQVSNHYDMLRDQVKIEKSEHAIQYDMGIDENIFKSKISITAKENMPNVSEDKNEDYKRKFMNEDK